MNTTNNKESIKKGTKNLALWTSAWLTMLLIVTIGPDVLWDNDIITLSGIVINLIIGIVMLISNKNLFNNYDEFQRKIQLESMAFTLGFSVIFGVFFEKMYSSGLIDLKPKIHLLVIFISITYIISLIINVRRYK
jgi:hypothetical protein